mmetsp:Transcript_15928/g.29144  ORF Transcript_15928/g.29144 Transcript_15928/m.29144 type:complete len:102 (-) Transcript_15928:123-428(-)
MDFLGLLRSIMPNSTSISCVKKPLRSFTEEEARALVLFPQLSELTLTKASLTDILLFPLLPNLRILNLSLIKRDGLSRAAKVDYAKLDFNLLCEEASEELH